MLEKFFPDEYLDSTYSIDFERLYREGIRGIIFDIDNTLVPHGAPADERAEGLFQRLKEMGFSCCLLSNNQFERVSSFNKNIQVHFIEDAHKPGRKNYLKAMELMGPTWRIRFLSETSFLQMSMEPKGPEYAIFW